MEMIKNFDKKDIRFLILLFSFLIFLIGVNLRVSLRKGRDNIRKTDMSALQGALEKFQEKYRVFPESVNGKIVGCFADDTYFDPKEGRYVNLRICEWGEDGFENLTKLPRDPLYKKKREYLYISNSRRYQIFTSLEGKKESEYTESIANRNLICGNSICNFGKSYGSLPLDISIEKYEETVNQ